MGFPVFPRRFHIHIICQHNHISSNLPSSSLFYTYIPLIPVIEVFSALLIFCFVPPVNLTINRANFGSFSHYTLRSFHIFCHSCFMRAFCTIHQTSSLFEAHCIGTCTRVCFASWLHFVSFIVLSIEKLNQQLVLMFFTPNVWNTFSSNQLPFSSYIMETNLLTCEWSHGEISYLVTYIIIFLCHSVRFSLKSSNDITVYLLLLLPYYVCNIL